ncbi:MAG: hypothetical protein DVB32_09490 [Verrucomicrobia bacterium]|jgi:hypothetical protein|nr:MAG: hypothetical protein DVB32_09490 [Verrucomicrobiota bacterium]
MMTIEEAKIEIREVIRHAAEGGYYPEERSRLDIALSALRSHARSYEHEHIRELEIWISTLASHQKLRRHSGGSSQVRAWILGCLDKVGWHTPKDSNEPGNA